MKTKDLQIIKDEIISHKNAINDVEDKISLLNFLDNIDESIDVNLMFDKDNLMNKRKELETKLGQLLDKKTGLATKKDEIENQNNNNSYYIEKYLAFFHNFVNNLNLDKCENTR